MLEMADYSVLDELPVEPFFVMGFVLQLVLVPVVLPVVKLLQVLPEPEMA